MQLNKTNRSDAQPLLGDTLIRIQRHGRVGQLVCASFLAIAGLFAFAGCTVDTGPGTTVNSGKSQCHYKITGIASSCSVLIGQEICIEECTGASTATCEKATSSWTLQTAGYSGTFSVAANCEFATFALINCAVCATTIPDGW